MSDNKKTSNKRDKNILLDYDFDGIQEFDNPPPPWLMYVLYASIFFAAIYWVHYHTFAKGELQDQEYITEMETAKTAMEAKNNDATLSTALTLLTDDADLAEGAKIFVSSNCIACHGAAGEGNAVGPNLTDDFWISGNKFAQVHDIIKLGKIAKGMTPSENVLNDKQISQVASYILVKLKGSNPPNAKAPQGEKME